MALSGSGTPNDPYLIKNKEDFLMLNQETERDKYDGKYIKLTADIDLDGNTITSFVDYDWIFDGDNHTIRNVLLSNKSMFNCGASAIFKDFRIENITAVPQETSPAYSFEAYIFNVGSARGTDISNIEIRNLGGKISSHTGAPSCGVCFITGAYYSNVTISNCCVEINAELSFEADTYLEMAFGFTKGTGGGTIKNCFADIKLNGTIVSHNDGVRDYISIGFCTSANASNLQINDCVANLDLNIAIVADAPTRANVKHGFVLDDKVSVINSYQYYTSDNITLNTEKVSHVASEQATTEQVNDKSFYIDTLGWDENIWSFADLDAENGKFPTLLLTDMIVYFNSARCGQLFANGKAIQRVVFDGTEL